VRQACGAPQPSERAPQQPRRGGGVIGVDGAEEDPAPRWRDHVMAASAVAELQEGIGPDRSRCHSAMSQHAGKRGFHDTSGACALSIRAVNADWSGETSRGSDASGSKVLLPVPRQTEQRR